MTNSAEPQFQVVSSPESKTPRNCALGCGGILALLLLGGGIAASSANRKLEARREAAAERVLALADAGAQPRTNLLGPTADEENAVVDYNGLIWALSLGDMKKMSQAWQRKRPTLPESIDDVVARIGGTKEFDYTVLNGFVEHFDPRHGAPLDERTIAEFERFRPAVAYVRAGVRRGRCDWETRWEQGMELDIPNLLHVRSAANILAYESTTQPPREALETGLVILAFGDDLDRQGTLIGSMIAIAVRSIGYRSLCHTMGRPGLEEQDYQRVLDALPLQTQVSTSDMIRREALAGEITVLRLGGRPLEVSPDPAAPSSSAAEIPAGLGALASLSFLQERELRGYAEFMERAAQVESLPFAEREAAWGQLTEEISESSYLFAQMATPNLSALSVNVHEIRALSDATRVIAAAHLVRLRTGAFPGQIEALAPLVGAIPLDPHSPGKPLTYLLEGDVLVVYSVGADGADNLGAKDTDDRALATRVPQGE